VRARPPRFRTTSVFSHSFSYSRTISSFMEIAALMTSAQHALPVSRWRTEITSITSSQRMSGMVSALAILDDFANSH
jgi:hypothetical protein